MTSKTSRTNSSTTMRNDFEEEDEEEDEEDEIESDPSPQAKPHRRLIVTETGELLEVDDSEEEQLKPLVQVVNISASSVQ